MKDYDDAKVTKAKKTPLTDDQLLAQINEYERRSLTYYGSEISTEMRVAQDYYLGKPLGTEEEGRSQVMSSDVWDVVEGMVPSLLEPFVASDDVVKFEPVGPEDVATAEQETEVINHIVTQQNNVFETLVAWAKQGLLQKNGVVKYWWEEQETPRIERYEVSEDEYLMLLQQPNVEVLEHSEDTDDFGEVMHEVKIRVVEKGGIAKYAVVPHEEFRIDASHTSVNPQTANFVQHARKVSLSDLRLMGYDVADDISDAYDADSTFNELYQARRTAGEQQDTQNEVDPSMRQVMYRETYIRTDYDGDGIAELRRVCVVGSDILHNEEIEEIPFVAWSPYPQPHKFYGRCPADETTEIQLIKTALMRQMFDNIYTINNNRTFIGRGVNVDDLIDNVIGGHIRVDADVVGNQVFSAPIQPIGGIIQPVIEYLDSSKETRTGFTRYNQGTDANSLNKTATGVRIITAQGNLRVDLIRRNLAECGLKPLMLGIHGLMRRHGTKALTVRIRGKYVQIDPRAWRERADMSVSVGLGSSDKQMQLQGIQLLMNEQKQLAQAGLAKPRNLYASAMRLTSALGYKDGENYFAEPPEQEPPPPDPMNDPEVMFKMAESKRKDRELDLRERELDLKERAQQQDMLIKHMDVEAKSAGLVDPATLLQQIAQLEAQLAAVEAKSTEAAVQEYAPAEDQAMPVQPMPQGMPQEQPMQAM